MSDVTTQDILDGFRLVGIRPGDLLLVHSSLSSFGRLDGGAETVVDALIQSVSPGGTVVVPTFNYGTLAYDPATTQSLTGAVTEAFWRRPGAVRSAHPTHSFAAIGPDAAELMRDHPDDRPFGPGSPLWKLWERDARVLLIGVDHTANSMIHLAEEAMAVPYLGNTRVGYRRRGTEVTEVVVGRPGCSHGFNAIADANPLRWIETTVGSALLILTRAQLIVSAASELLKRDPAALLCNRPDCDRCARARQKISEQPRSA